MLGERSEENLAESASCIVVVTVPEDAWLVEELVVKSFLFS